MISADIIRLHLDFSREKCHAADIVNDTRETVETRFPTAINAYRLGTGQGLLISMSITSTDFHLNLNRTAVQSQLDC